MKVLTLHQKQLENQFLVIPLNLIYVLVSEKTSVIYLSKHSIVISKEEALKIVDAQRNNENITLHI